MARAPADDWFEQADPWGGALADLRALLRSCGLEETVKWRQPCYTDEGRNIALLSADARGPVVSFFLGALLSDPAGVLEQPGPHTRSARTLRAPDPDAVARHAPALRAFVAEAVALARAGRAVPPPDPDALVLVDALQDALAADLAFAEAFAALTPGRRRAYNLIVGQAKRPATRAARVEKYRDRIHAGKGPHDCTCGRTRRPPGCDGSHRR